MSELNHPTLTHNHDEIHMPLPPQVLLFNTFIKNLVLLQQLEITSNNLLPLVAMTPPIIEIMLYNITSVYCTCNYLLIYFFNLALCKYID